jgi:hypothetical protein
MQAPNVAPMEPVSLSLLPGGQPEGWVVNCGSADSRLRCRGFQESFCFCWFNCLPVSFIGQSKRYATRICKFTVPSGVSRFRPAPQAGLPHKRATKPIHSLLLLIFCTRTGRSRWPSCRRYFAPATGAIVDPEAANGIIAKKNFHCNIFISYLCQSPLPIARLR